MSNTLTRLIPDAYAALEVVSRELTGLVVASTMDANAERAAVGQAVIIGSAPAATAEDVTPGTNPPDTGDQVMAYESLTITKARAVPFRWTGEEQRGLNNGGAGYLNIRQQQIAQAIRTLVNEMEADGAALYTRSSRAYGTAGTTPFASGVGDTAQLRKILVDNGCPDADLQLVVNTDAGANLRTNTQLTKANEAGTVAVVRQGVLVDMHGFAIRESAQIKRHTAGTGAGYLLNDASPAVGDTSIAVDTGTGTILAGDVITFAGSPQKYVVGTALSGGVLTINKPGMMVAESDNDAITVGATYAANMAFHRGAILLACRPPAIPEEGDQASDVELITDPRTGLTFEIRMYPQYRRVRYEICLAWGWANIKPAHTAILLG